MTCDDCCDADGEWRGCNPNCRCRCHDEVDDDCDDERDAPCIGADCCNPAIDHRRDECCTVEMMKAWAEIDTPVQPPPPEPIRVYLDDVRDPPRGWTVARTADDAIAMLVAGNVEEMSLDHDLGGTSTGYEVATWIEQRVASGAMRFPPRLSVHSANPVGRARIEACIASIDRLRAAGIPVTVKDPPCE